MCIRDSPPEAGDYPGTGAVYDVDAIGLTELITRLNEGVDFHHRAIDGPTSFYCGVAVNPTADDLELEAERFRRKVDAGARFAMTQVLFDLSYLESFLERVGGSPIPLLVGVWPIRSLELAVRVHNEVPGIVVPDDLQEALAAAGPSAPEVGLAHARELYAQARDQAAGDEGLELARELIAGARKLASGVYVVAPFRRPLGVLDLLASL